VSECGRLLLLERGAALFAAAASGPIVVFGDGASGIPVRDQTRGRSIEGGTAGSRFLRLCAWYDNIEFEIVPQT
jgi:hypothetical protein